MKKIYALLLLGFFNLANAQVPNADFEQAFGYGETDVTSWGRFYIFEVAINPETGENTSDEIIFDADPGALGMFCLSVPDAHDGGKAMLIRNAFNVTKNEIIVGRADLFNTAIDSFPSGWNIGVPVEANAQINSLGFWYKFHKLGNDVAEAKLETFDANGESIGTAKIQLSEETHDYTYAAVPMTFTNIADPTFMTISFSLEAEGSQATFGSWLLVDSVVVDNAVLKANTFENSEFAVFPTLANSQISIRGNGGKYNVSIFNVQGQRISQTHMELKNGVSKPIDVSTLANGVYFLKAENNGMTVTKKFIKK